jgi:hypothetical protein
MLNIALTWGLLYIIIGLAMSIYIEIESPIWKLILYYIGVILFWPIIAIVFITALIIHLFKQILK